MALAHRAKNTYAALPFISTWKTNNLSTGSSANNQVKLPLVSTGTYKFTVNWGDGSSNVITTWNQAQVTHTYAAIGTYTITITGFIKGWQFGPETPTPPTTGDRLKLLTITQFGCLRFTDDAFMFHGCENLTLTTVNDIANLKGVTNCHGFFRRCLALTTVNNLNKLDVSKIQNFRRFFGLVDNFNQNIGNWNVGKGSVFNSMFFAFSTTTGGNFNNGNDPSIGNWDMSSAVDLSGMFTYQGKFNQNIGAWDVSNVTTLASTFYGSTVPPYGVFDNGGSDSINNWNTGNVTNMAQAFQYQSNFNRNIGNWDTSKVTTFNLMFFASPGTFNQDISQWNTSNVLVTRRMFEGQSFNQNINTKTVTINGSTYTAWDMSKVTNMENMFLSATLFNQPINNWNVSLVTNFNNFMTGKTFNDYSTANYDALLIGWASRPVKPNISINFGTIKRTASSTAARAILTSAPNNWTIVDGGI